MTKAIFPSKDKSVSPTELLKRWLNVRGSYGTLFTRILKGKHITDERLTPQSVRLIVKQTAAKAGLSLDLTAHRVHNDGNPSRENRTFYNEPNRVQINAGTTRILPARGCNRG